MITKAIHAGSTSHLDERQQSGRHQELVGKRVEELAEGRDLVAGSREIAVHAVSGGQARRRRQPRSRDAAGRESSGPWNQRGQSASNTSRKTGIRIIRTRVTVLAGFRLTPEAFSRGAFTVPRLPGHSRSSPRYEPRRAAPGSPRSSSTSPSISGACPRHRPTIAPSSGSKPCTSTSRTSPTRDAARSTPMASAASRAALGPGASRPGGNLVRKARGRGPFLGRVGEHPDVVEPGSLDEVQQHFEVRRRLPGMSGDEGGAQGHVRQRRAGCARQARESRRIPAAMHRTENRRRGMLERHVEVANHVGGVSDRMQAGRR